MTEYTVIHSSMDYASFDNRVEIHLTHLQVPRRTKLEDVIEEAGIESINCIFEGTLIPEVYP